MYIKTWVLFVLLLLLIVRGFFYYQNISKYNDGEQIRIETTLLSEPKTTNRFQKFYIDHRSNRIFVTTSLYPEFHYSDRLHISGTIKVKVLTDGDKILLLNFPKIEAKNENKNLVLAASSLIRQDIIDFFQKNLSPNGSGLLLGIVFGIKEFIPEDFIKELKVAGVMHVIAASGMNVTLVGGFMLSIFSIFFRRQIALLISIFGILFYAVLAGLEPSIVRASIMGILVFSASIFGRQMWPAYSLLFTGYLMLIWDPALISDIGFQLSFLATAGLLYSNPLIKNPVVESFQTTFFAQIATLPILLANFGTYSLWSILVNTLILWTVPFLMVIGGVSSIISFLFEPLARILLFLSLPILIFFESVVKFFSGIGGIVLVESLSWQIIAGYYLILASLAWYRR